MSSDGNPLANHESMHAVGDAPAWSESFYFNFVDPVSRIGMFTRMGFRPGDGWADALHAVYLGNPRVVFTYGRRSIDTDLSAHDGDLHVGDLRLAVEEPYRRWRIGFHGPAQDIADGTVLMQRSKLRTAGWYRDATLDLDLVFECLSEPHLTPGSRVDGPGHFEQSGRVRGYIRLDGEEWQVDGHGVRDKSWGPRDWGAGKRASESGTPENKRSSGISTPEAPAPFVNWFSMNFGAETALGGSCFRRASGEIRGSGWMLHEGRAGTLEDVVISSSYREGTILHDEVILRGVLDGGEPIEITGRVINLCPTKVPMPGGATFINEGLAEFDWNGRTGYGIAEHWHAVTHS